MKHACSFSGFVPCFNNLTTVRAALVSLQAQSVHLAELFMVDDASEDGSRLIAQALNVPVISMGINAGRGSVRARAIEVSNGDFLLCCDATNYLPSDFAERALAWFHDPKVAAVYGQITQHEPKTLSDRWRDRHLFKKREAQFSKHLAGLSTWGCVLRRSAVLKVGNFNPRLRHGEDAELGCRLIAEGFDIVFDPDLHVIANSTNTIRQVLERYWRWNSRADEGCSLYLYAKQVWYSIKVMVFLDLRERDPLAIPISLFSPHYQFWKTWLSRRSSGAN